jgi:arylsulfatase
MLLAMACCLQTGLHAQAQGVVSPNVLIVMVDDMGYGDLSCHGSPFVETANLDRFHDSAIRLTDFHTAPMCSPTRAQLLTGLDAMRNGSTIVASSRMMVRADAPMLPAHFAAAGYATGSFGKWHLGENYPHRPHDRGFEETLWFPLQEIGSISDHWCNDYFDPVLRHRDISRPMPGYCTDIFFEQAIGWMRQQHAVGRRFLCYLPLNVLHGPQWAPAERRREIARQFPQLNAGQIGYLAMLANLDDNFGRVEEFLVESDLDDNTIVIFLSDNGGYALIDRYNAGMRDGKSRLAEGGHRVACFIRWPGGGLGGNAGGREVGGLTEVQDLLPTLLDLCGVTRLPGPDLDGISLAAPLRDTAEIPDRTLIVQYGQPQPFHMTCVMRGKWRLLTDIKGTARGEPELYNLADDPQQRHNLIESEPERATELRAAYDRWWGHVEPQTRQRARITIGHVAQNPVVLNCAEWREGAVSSVERLRQGVKRHGIWDLEVDRAGKYEITLHRWPIESELKLREGAPAWQPRDTLTPSHSGYAPGKSLLLTQAHLTIGGLTQTVDVMEDALAASFNISLDSGPTECEAFFSDGDRKPACAAFFTRVRYVEEQLAEP